ncbi:MAG: alanine--glyoxylate aminotransferase family protein [Candidatus Eisenbacteria bacterium]|uniref:Alanine--glyoxylate aminotransferase family protein n=1 Tax=Eiseniibacteriota bacterium TaxID=2212470 RepID=A0A956RNK8_UNCEI|nr:alanine--glyoxylate aminotransferase family protein [Candidatus Eisenbacteria bacterium]
MNSADRTILMTPGPVNLHPRVREALGSAIVHHRTGPFRDLVRGVNRRLQQVFATEQPVLILTTSGTGAMEASVANLFSPGDRVGVISSGKFGERWAELAGTYGLEPHLLTVPWGESADPGAVARLLDETSPRGLLFTHCETSTGALHPVREIAAEARRRGVLTVVDGITGLIAHELAMDAWGIDVVVGGSQKAFMLPPGLAFVGLSAQAQDAVRASKNPRYYLDLRPALEQWEAGDFPFTPGVGLIQGLDVALQVIFEEGLAETRARFHRMAERTRDGVRELGLRIYPQHPSDSLTVAQVPEGIDGKAVLDRIVKEDGIRLAGGQGKLKNKIWRFGHMGYLRDEDVEASLAAMKRALQAAGPAAGR